MASAKGPCRECGAALTHWARRPLCANCRDFFCSRCDRRLPADYHHTWCRECLAEKRALRFSQPGRRCRMCNGIPTRAFDLCSECHRAEYELKCRLSARKGRPCRTCGVLMPAGRMVSECRDCHRETRANYPARRLPCAACGQGSRARGSCYCRACKNIHQNLSRAIRLGDSLARLASPRRRYVRRQEKSR